MPTSTKKRSGPVKQTQHQKDIARATLKKLRAENPDRFNPKKNGAIEKFQKRSKERAVIRAAQKPPELTLDDPKRNPPAPPAPTPAPTPAAPPAPPTPAAGPKVIEVNQDQLFSTPAAVPQDPPKPPTPDPAAPAPGDPAAGPKEVPSGEPGPDKTKEDPKNEPRDPNANRAMAIMVWGMILQMMITLFGEEMLPKKYTTPAGEFDENENVILAFIQYFDTLGFTKLSPFWNLIMTIAAYFLVRMNHLVNWFKARRARRNPTNQQTDNLKSAATPPPGPQPGPEKPATGPEQRPSPPQEPVEESETAEPAFR